MSTGFVICSVCHREVHQTGDRAIRNGWIHCEDGAAICEDAHAQYPATRADIKGAFCGCDGPPPVDLSADDLRAVAGVDVASGDDYTSTVPVQRTPDGRLAIDHVKGYFRSDRDATRPDTSIPRMHSRLRTGVATTEAAMAGRFAGDNGRLNQARAFLKRAKKSDVRRKMEKRTRKANRRRR